MSSSSSCTPEAEPRRIKSIGHRYRSPISSAVFFHSARAASRFSASCRIRLAPRLQCSSYESSSVALEPYRVAFSQSEQHGRTGTTSEHAGNVGSWYGGGGGEATRAKSGKQCAEEALAVRGEDVDRRMDRGHRTQPPADTGDVPLSVTMREVVRLMVGNFRRSRGGELGVKAGSNSGAEGSVLGSPLVEPDLPRPGDDPTERDRDRERDRSGEVSRPYVRVCEQTPPAAAGDDEFKKGSNVAEKPFNIECHALEVASPICGVSQLRFESTSACGEASEGTGSLRFHKGAHL